MSNKSKIYKPEFGSLEEENAYLKRKIEFLLSHAECLAGRHVGNLHMQSHAQLKELLDIKNSRSWRITFPLRKANRIYKRMLNRISR